MQSLNVRASLRLLLLLVKGGTFFFVGVDRVTLALVMLVVDAIMHMLRSMGVQICDQVRGEKENLT